MIAVHPLTLFLIISTVIGRSSSQDEPLKPTLTLVWGNQQLLVGEAATMLCTIPGNNQSDWKYWWFKDGLPIHQFGLYDESYTLAPRLPQDGGLYTCQGRINTTETGLQDTLQSHPLKIDVAGGWVILQVPPAPSLTGDDITLTCHVRGKKRVTEVVFFKDGLELQRQARPSLHLSRLTKQDQGVYWCRATWWAGLLWHSSQSLPVEVPVSEVLTTPQLVVLPGTSIMEGKQLHLWCQVQFNSRNPELHPRYHFYRGHQKLGVATAAEHFIITKAGVQHSGLYHCRVIVNGLGLTKLSREVKVEVLKDPSERSSQPLSTGSIPMDLAGLSSPKTGS